MWLGGGEVAGTFETGYGDRFCVWWSELERGGEEKGRKGQEVQLGGGELNGCLVKGGDEGADC